MWALLGLAKSAYYREVLSFFFFQPISNRFAAAQGDLLLLLSNNLLFVIRDKSIRIDIILYY
jgi:hypothetical protein